MLSKKETYFQNEYQKVNFFQKRFDDSLEYLSDTNKNWNKTFRDEIKDFLSHKISLPQNFSLHEIHHHLTDDLLKIEKGDNPSNDRNEITKLMFEFAESKNNSYINFIEWLYRDVIKKDFYFQRIPTIRLHIPQENFLYPKWHSDCFLGHSPKEINCWFGLTNNAESGFWVIDLKKSRKWISEFDYNFKNFLKKASSLDKEFNDLGFQRAVEIKNICDSILLFDSRCIHTALNRTKSDATTRVSIDIRVILKEEFEWVKIDEEPLYVGKGVKKAEFRPGHPYGYHEKSIKEFLNE